MVVAGATTRDDYHSGMVYVAHKGWRSLLPCLIAGALLTLLVAWFSSTFGIIAGPQVRFELIHPPTPEQKAVDPFAVERSSSAIIRSIGRSEVIAGPRSSLAGPGLDRAMRPSGSWFSLRTSTTGLPRWCRTWGSQHAKRNGLNRVLPNEQFAFGWPFRAMWCGLDYDMVNGAGHPNFHSSAINLRERLNWRHYSWFPYWWWGTPCLPLVVMPLGFAADSLFWAAICWMHFRGGRFARSRHAEPLRISTTKGPLAWLLCHRNVIWWTVRLGGFAAIVAFVALFIAPGYFGEVTRYDTLVPTRPHQTYRRLGTTLTDAVYGEMPDEARSIRTYYGTPRTYRFDYRIFVRVDGTSFGKPAQTVEGEMLGLAIEPRCVRIRWEDGTVSESVELGPRSAWNHPDDTGLPFPLEHFSDRTPVAPGTNWFPEHLWYDAAVCAIFAAPFVFPLIILVQFMTRKPLWRLGPAPRKCPMCRYDLRMLEQIGCPECGWARTRYGGT